MHKNQTILFKKKINEKYSNLPNFLKKKIIYFLINLKENKISIRKEIILRKITLFNKVQWNNTLKFAPILSLLIEA